MKFIKEGDSKKVIVFLHGWGQDKTAFLWTKNYFSDWCKIYVDFAGFGENPEPDKVFSLTDYVQSLKNLLDDFEIESLVLVGHSFGGRVAIKFAFLYQECFKNFKLCLVDTAGLKPRKSFVKWLKIKRYKRLKRKAEKKVELRQKLDAYGSADYKKLSSKMKQTFVKIVNEDLSHAAKFIKCRTCIVWGKDDTETKLYMAKRLFKLIKDSELYIFKNAGHFCYLDKPQEFLIILDTFIKN